MGDKPSQLDPREVLAAPLVRQEPEPRFCVIGPPKCGTWSMRAWLKSMGAVVPPNEWVFGLVMGKLKDEPVDGTIAPIMSCDRVVPAWVYAELLQRAYPSIKALMIRRDPVQRAHSEWRMYTATGAEKRPFRGAMRDCLEGRWSSDPALNDYISNGEYDRIEGYYRNRGIDIISIELADLIADPVARAGAARHLGFDPDLAARTPYPHEHPGVRSDPILPEDGAVISRMREHYYWMSA